MKHLFVMAVALVEMETKRLRSLAETLSSNAVLTAAAELRKEFMEAMAASGIELAYKKYEKATEEVGEAGMLFWSKLSGKTFPPVELHEVKTETHVN